MYWGTLCKEPHELRSGDRSQGERSQEGARRPHGPGDWSARRTGASISTNTLLGGPLPRSTPELLHSRKLLLNHCRGAESERAQGREVDFQGHRLKKHFLKQAVCICGLSPRPAKSSTQKASPMLPSGTITIHSDAGLGLGAEMLGVTFTICTRNGIRLRPSFTKSPAN